MIECRAAATGLSGSKPGHVRYVAESGSKFRALAATAGANRKDPICFSLICIARAT
jgi:hypothetical protein